MDSAEPAEKFAALEAELATKSSCIAELEARVSLLEAENARLRRAMAKGEAPDLTGEGDPILGRLEEVPSGQNRTASGKEGEDAGCDVVVLSDGEEGIAVDANKGRNPMVDVAAVPTARKRAMHVGTGESEEDEGGSERNNEEACYDSNVSLEDDDVSVTPKHKKRSAARVVTSDSEDEDVNVGELGSGEDDDQEGVIMPSRKRTLPRISDSENEDANDGVDVAGSEHTSVMEVENEDEGDRIPIYDVLKKIRRRKRVSHDDESDGAQGCSTPGTRRSARLVKKKQAAPHVLKFVEPVEREVSKDESEEDDDMDDFINDDVSAEDASDSAEASCDEPEVSGASAVNEESTTEPEESDIVEHYKEAMDCIGRKKKNMDWVLEGDMLAAFRQNPELCLKAVCALYRKQTEDEQFEKSALFHNKQGFSQIHATRGSLIADFLLDGDPNGPLKKTVDDLEAHDCSALAFCQMAASHYSKQLFAIYQNKEDPYFHP